MTATHITHIQLELLQHTIADLIFSSILSIHNRWIEEAGFGKSQIKNCVVI